MAITEILSLKASLVLPGLRLFPGDSDVGTFREKSQREVLQQVGGPVIVVGGSPSPSADFSLRLEQERITITVTDRGSSIEREYLREDDLPEFSEVIADCIESSSLTEDGAPSAFGYNLEIRCKQDSGKAAKHYLAERVLRPGLTSWGEVEGTSVTIKVQEDEQQWTFTLEPRLQEEETRLLFLQANYHFDAQRIPGPEEVGESLKLLWSRTVELIKRIDEGNGVE